MITTFAGVAHMPGHRKSFCDTRPVLRAATFGIVSTTSRNPRSKETGEAADMTVGSRQDCYNRRRDSRHFHKKRNPCARIPFATYSISTLGCFFLTLILLPTNFWIMIAAPINAKAVKSVYTPDVINRMATANKIILTYQGAILL